MPEAHETPLLRNPPNNRTVGCWSFDTRVFCIPFVFVLSTLIVTSGCGGVRPTSGGTSGVLRTGSEFAGDIHVTIHRVQGTGFEQIGFGETTKEGKFELYTNGAKGPLTLTPGEYRCTLMSSGSPLFIPEEYARPETTPLKINWSGKETLLELNLTVPPG